MIKLDGLGGPALRGAHARQAGLRVQVVREGLQRDCVLLLGLGQLAAVEIQVPELPCVQATFSGAGPPAFAACSIAAMRAGDIAVQLAGIRDARIGAEVGAEVDHALERIDGLLVLPQLDLRVADDPVGIGFLRAERLGLLAPFERGAELVARHLERAHAGHGVEVARVQRQRARERISACA